MKTINEIIVKYLNSNYFVNHRFIYPIDFDDKTRPLKSRSVILDAMLVFGTEYQETLNCFFSWSVINGLNVKDLQGDYRLAFADANGLADELPDDDDDIELTEAEYENIRLRLKVTDEQINGVLVKMNNNRVLMRDFYRNEGFLIR